MAQKNFLALDLEFNQPSERIIQVGVAIGNIDQLHEDYLVRQWLIDPQESIAPEIVQLTGITDEAIKESSVSLEQCARELAGLIEKHTVFANPVTWGGGDSERLLKAFADKSIEFRYFGRRWVDIKTHFVLRAIASNKGASVGLYSAMVASGLKFMGTAHRADVDAFNTLRLFFAVIQRTQSVNSIISSAKQLPI